MSTLTEIYTALQGVLTTAIADIDQASTDEFLPQITTQRVALILPPMGLRGNIGWQTPTRTPLLQSHRIPCEFWVRVNNGELAASMARGREICLLAARAVIASGDLGGVVMGVGHYLINGESSGPDLEYRVDEELIDIGRGKNTFIRATLYVPVVDYADG